MKNPWWIVLGLFSVCIGFKLYWFFPTVGPVIFGDELLNRDFAERLFKLQPYNPLLLPSSSRYPFIYPLLLSPAFWSKHWYEFMIFINIIISSTIVIPVYLISRQILSGTWVILPVILTAILPYHAVYPGLIMAENLMMPFFIFAIYLSIFYEKRDALSPLLFGSFLALGFLTKYLFLPAAFVLSVVWLSRSWKSKDTPKQAILLLSGSLLPLSVWIIYALQSNFPMSYAFGGADYKSEPFYPPWHRLPFWATYYGSYCMLMAGPYLGLLFTLPRPQTSNTKKLWITSGLLALGYLAMATKHSWDIYYNYPTPAYLLGRYLIYFEPIIILLGTYSLAEISKRPFLKSRLFVFLSGVTALSVVCLSYGVLYKNWIENLPPWFATLTVNSPNTSYLSAKAPWYLLIITLISFTALAFPKERKGLAKGIYCLLLLQTGLALLEMHRLNTTPSITSLHARRIAEILNHHVQSDHKFIIVLSEGTQDVIPEHLAYGLKFWNYPYAVITHTDSPDLSEARFLVSNIKGNSSAKNYHVGEEEFYVFMKRKP